MPATSPVEQKRALADARLGGSTCRLAWHCAPPCVCGREAGQAARHGGSPQGLSASRTQRGNHCPHVCTAAPQRLLCAWQGVTRIEGLPAGLAGRSTPPWPPFLPGTVLRVADARVSNDPAVACSFVLVSGRIGRDAQAACQTTGVKSRRVFLARVSCCARSRGARARACITHMGERCLTSSCSPSRTTITGHLHRPSS